MTHGQGKPGTNRSGPEDPDLPQWAQDTRLLADAQLDNLDAATRSRLNQARQRALDEGLRPRSRRWQWPALAVASACGVMLVLTLGVRTAAPVIDTEPLTDAKLARSTGSHEPAAGALSATLPAAPMSEPEYEMLVAGEDLELIENLEFYAWLDQQSLDG